MTLIHRLINLHMYDYCTQEDLTQIFPTIPNLTVNLDFYIKFFGLIFQPTEIRIHQIRETMQ